MVTIPVHEWTPVVLSDGTHTASIFCPGCKRKAVLDHEIGARGAVTPSVVCPFGCGFHDHVQLAGWGRAT